MCGIKPPQQKKNGRVSSKNGRDLKKSSDRFFSWGVMLLFFEDQLPVYAEGIAAHFGDQIEA